MSKLKQFAKYILMIIGMFLFTLVLEFISLNANYSDITYIGAIPEQVSIEKAETTKKNCRIYGYVYNNDNEDVNNKYLKISVYDSNNDVLMTEYLKITDVEYGEKKLFKAYFNVEKVSTYSLSIVEEEGV